MGRLRYGFQITQEGVPLHRAADYQKVLDDRWPFLDILVEREVKIEQVVTARTSSYYWASEIYAHKLGFLPGFMYRFVVDPEDSTVEVLATKTGIYIKGIYYSGNPSTTRVFKVYLRVFKVDMLKEVSYNSEDITPAVRVKARKYGAKVLKPGVSGKNIGSEEMSDFSLNTDAKALAIQQIGMLDLNPWSRSNPASVTAIDTTTNILTLGLVSSTHDIGWTTVAGNAIFYTPGDYFTYPNPISVGNTYYIIPVGTNQIKLANSYKDALLGNAIDITTAGALPGQMVRGENASNPENIFTHNAGYPPTYLMAEYRPYADRATASLKYLVGEDVIGPLGGFSSGFVSATQTTLAFTGAQAVASGRYAIMILKDPLGVAA